MKNLKPNVRELIIAVITAVLTFLTTSCSAGISAEKLEAQAEIRAVQTLADDLAKPE